MLLTTGCSVNGLCASLTFQQIHASMNEHHSRSTHSLHNTQQKVVAICSARHCNCQAPQMRTHFLCSKWQLESEKLPLLTQRPVRKTAPATRTHAHTALSQSTQSLDQNPPAPAETRMRVGLAAAEPRRRGARSSTMLESSGGRHNTAHSPPAPHAANRP